METSYLTSNELNYLDNEMFHCINKLKVWKKGSNIDNIHKQIIKINDFKEISKDYLLARLATSSNEQKIEIKLFNNSASYSVNEDLIDLQTVNSMQYSPLRSSPVPIADTPVCNHIDDSIQDMLPVPIVDTPACNNNNSSIQDIPSPLSDTISPQQTPVTLKLLNKSYSDLYSQSIAIKEFLLNEICILPKEVYTNKDRMEHLMSSLQDKNKITELTIQVSLLEEENLTLRNKIIENNITIGKMQNVSNTGKDSQAKPEELNMTKLVDNGEILTLDIESMSNEPLSKNRFALNRSKNR